MKKIFLLIIASLTGSCIGVLIVSKLSDKQFQQLVPLLLMIVAIALTFGQKIRKRFNQPMISVESRWLCIFQFIIAIYAGVYGGGVAIIMLAVYGFLHSIHSEHHSS